MTTQIFTRMMPALKLARCSELFVTTSRAGGCSPLVCGLRPYPRTPMYTFP
jgi:hypothetical protein